MPHSFPSDGGRINTICLPLDDKPNETYQQLDATVAGWGINDGNPKSINVFK